MKQMHMFISKGRFVLNGSYCSIRLHSSRCLYLDHKLSNSSHAPVFVVVDRRSICFLYVKKNNNNKAKEKVKQIL